MGSVAVAYLDAAISWMYSLRPLVSRTLILVPSGAKECVESISNSTQQDVDVVAMVLGMFLCYPLGIVMKALPFGKLKHLFSCFLGCVVLQFVLGNEWIHLFITSVLSYTFLSILPPKVSRIVVPAFAMTYCVCGHLHRQYTNYMGWDLDFTAAQMVLTIKLYSLSWNIYDGSLIATSRQGGGKKPEELPRATKQYAEFALAECPDLLDYLGYTFCFSNVLAGPAFEFKTYQNAANGTLFQSSEKGRQKKKLPSVWKHVLYPLATSVACLLFYVFISSKLPVMDPVNPQKNRPIPLAKGSGYSIYDDVPAWRRLIYLFFALSFQRAKYYFAWKNAEGACNLWHAGFVGYDEEGEPIEVWENTVNVEILKCEAPSNIRMGTKFWNKKTALWLSRYVYSRVGGNLLLTYFMSAFWHGFYPGYYLFFLSLPLLTACERMGRKKLTPRFGRGGGRFSAWGIVSILTTQVFFTYCTMPFLLLSWEWSIELWRYYNFAGHILMVLFYVVCSLLPSPPSKGERGEKKKKDE